VNARIQTSNLSSLIELVHHRWNIPVLAQLQKHAGSKFVTLVNTLNVSRGSLSASLAVLIDLGLVYRNTGHGHPMRPEYLLADAGKELGAHCAALYDIIQRRKAADLAYRKWTLPLVAAIGDEVLRFNELKLELTDATPRAITLGLKSLVQERWATRTLIDDYPPAAGYQLGSTGQKILPCVEGLLTARSGHLRHHCTNLEYR